MDLKFAETLKKLREEKEVTQDELAEYLNVARSTLAGYETKGKQPSFETLLAMSEFFNVTADYLITGSYDNYIEIKYNCTAKEIKKIIKKYYSLSVRNRKNLYEYVDYLSKRFD